jgi:hypothetical protein
MKKITRPAWALLLAMFFALPGMAANAASLTVAVRQVNPNGAVQTVTCTLLQKGCVLPFVINAGQPTQQSLNIHVIYFSGGLALDFQTAGGYFYTSSTVGTNTAYNTLWNRRFQSGVSAPYTVTLFQPLGPNPFSRSFTIAGTSVASLQITATPGL